MLHTHFTPSVHGTGFSSVTVTQTRCAHSLRCQRIQSPSPLACTPLTQRLPAESAPHTDPTHTFIHSPALEPYIPVAHLPTPSKMMRHSAALAGEGATLHATGRCHSYDLVWPPAQDLVPQVLHCSPGAPGCASKSVLVIYSRLWGPGEDPCPLLASGSPTALLSKSESYKCRQNQEPDWG